jgi:hypothetical protein
MTAAHTTATYNITGADGRLVVDAPCLGCGYNLRTQHRDGRCPECNRPVAASLEMHYLRFAPPAWVARLRRGVLLLLLTLAAMIVLGPLASVGLGFTQMSGNAVPSRALMYLGYAVDLVGDAVVIGLAVAGLWCLSTPDPRPDAPTDGRTARRFGRFVCLMIPLPLVLKLLTATFMFSNMTALTTGAMPSADVFMTFMVIGLVSGIVSGVVVGAATLAVLALLVTISRRIPRPKLTRRVRILAWAIIPAFALVVGGTTLTVLVMQPWMNFAATAAAAATTAPAGTLPVTPLPTTGPATSAPAASLTPTTGPARISVTGGPGGTTVTTTMPIVPASFNPTTMLVSTLFTMCGGLASLAIVLGSIVALFVSHSALGVAAREARYNAALAAALAAAPTPPITDIPTAGAANEPGDRPPTPPGDVHS